MIQYIETANLLDGRSEDGRRTREIQGDVPPSDLSKLAPGSGLEVIQHEINGGASVAIRIAVDVQAEIVIELCGTSLA